MKKYQILLGFFFFLFSFCVKAQEIKEDAEEVLKVVIENTLKELQENKKQYEEDPDKVTSLINKEVLPHVNMKVMSQLVLGKYWREATDKQKVDFQNNFQKMLMSAYAKELINYIDSVVEYNGATDVVKNRTKVRGRIKTPKGEKYDVLLSLGYKDSSWKVYDVSLDGVSFVASFRSSFGEKISREGLDNVIKNMSSYKVDIKK